MIAVLPDAEFPTLPSIAPLERLYLPPHLDGSMLHRKSPAISSRREAGNDQDAITIWLEEVAHSDASFKSYRLESERCLLWATVERGKPLSALAEADLLDYARFLLDPQPFNRWVCIGKPTREDDSWRPFRGALSQRSAERALRIVSSLFKWLEATGYVQENPWHSPAVPPKGSDRKNTAPAKAMQQNESVASLVEWFYIRKALHDLSAECDEQTIARTRTVLYLAYYADMKPGEIRSLRTRSITPLASCSAPVWKLDIESRPSLLREVILLPPAQQALDRYLSSRGIIIRSGVQQFDGPVIVPTCNMPDSSELEISLSGQGSRAFTRHVFVRAAALAHAGGNRSAARRLSRITLNWLKHAFESHTVERDMPNNWCWLLLGANWLATPVLQSYLPPRVPLSVKEAQNAFDDLRRMWNVGQHEE